MKCEVCSTNLIPVQVWLFRGKKVCSECYNTQCDMLAKMGREVANIGVVMPELCKSCHSATSALAWTFEGHVVCRKCYEKLCNAKLKRQAEEVKHMPVGIIQNKEELIYFAKTQEDVNAIKNFKKAADFDDGRHDVSDEVMQTLKNVMHSQDDFGVDKYGVPLKFSHQYDWMAMFFEEMADGLKYIQAEMQRKIHVKGLLSDAIEHQNWKLVEAALQQLSISGTGTHKKKTSV